MTIPNMPTMEALLEDDGMDVRAGLPEELRQRLPEAKKRNPVPILEDLLAAGTLSEEAKKVLDNARRNELSARLKERADKLVSSMAEYESQIARLRTELREVLDEYARVSGMPKTAVSAA